MPLTQGELVVINVDGRVDERASECVIGRVDDRKEKGAGGTWFHAFESDEAWCVPEAG